MSKDESLKGKLIPVDLEGMTVEEMALSLIPRGKHVIVNAYYGSALEYLTTELDYFFDARSQTLFEICVTDNPVDSFIEINHNSDGSFDFVTRFYNGSTNLSEMLNEGLEKIWKEL